MTLKDILSDNEISKLTQFSPTEITWLEERMFSGTNDEGKTVAKVRCIVREKEIELKPEEVVRQLYAHKLIEEFNYFRFFQNQLNPSSPKKSRNPLIYESKAKNFWKAQNAWSKKRLKSRRLR